MYEPNSFSVVSESLVIEKVITSYWTIDTSTSYPNVFTPKQYRILGISDSPKRFLRVTGLSPSTRADVLQTMFSHFGGVASVKVYNEKKSTGDCYYADIAMCTKHGAHRSKTKLNNTKLHGNIMKITLVTPDVFGDESTASTTAISNPPGRRSGPAAAEPRPSSTTVKDQPLSDRGRTQTNDKCDRKEAEVRRRSASRWENEQNKIRRERRRIHEERLIVERERARLFDLEKKRQQQNREQTFDSKRHPLK